MSRTKNPDDEFKKRISKGRKRLSKRELRKAGKYLGINALKPVLGHIKDFLAILHAVFFEGYRLSVEVITSLVAAILYLIWTFDVIPDFTPVIGFTDDIIVILTAARMCAVELEKYRQWKGHKEEDLE